VKVIGVQGTGSWRPGQWWAPGSAFWAYMRTHGIEPALLDDVPFRWSTDAGNTWFPFRRWFGKSRFSDWDAAGDSLYYFTRGTRDIMPRVTVIAHSHGGQCVFMAAARGVKIHKLITIGTPVRADMRLTVNDARLNIRSWIHVSDRDTDLIGYIGALGDGRLGNAREFPQADVNKKITDIGHSDLLSKPAKFPLWESEGLIDFLKDDRPRETRAA
jgi:hypothetical protein